MSKVNWKKIREEWETTKITFKALAEKHDVPEGTLKSRRSREKWSRDATNKKDATFSKKMQPKKERKEPVVESDNLTEKQRLFCIYYIKYFNATKAYQKAYGCAYTTAMSNGHSLLRNTEIVSEIERMKEEQTSGLMLDVRDVLQKYIDIAFADITDFVEFGTVEKVATDSFGVPILDDEGDKVTYMDSYVLLNDNGAVDGTILTEVKQGRDGVSVKLADKMKALDMLAKYTDLLSDDDKKQLEKERIKTDIAKSKAETDKINKESDTGDVEQIVIVDEWTDDDE